MIHQARAPTFKERRQIDIRPITRGDPENHRLKHAQFGQGYLSSQEGKLSTIFNDLFYTPKD